MTMAQAKKNYKEILAAIEDQWQALTASEISLQECRATKSISKEQFHKRSLRLQELKHNLKTMKQQLQFETTLEMKSTTLDLLLERCRPLELAAIERYFNDKFKIFHDTYNSLLGFVPWVEDASRRRSSFFAIFRLAKIRHYLFQLKNEEKKLTLDIELQERLLKKLVSLVGQTESEDLLDGAQSAFQQEESITERISVLERKIQKKKQEIHYMKNWLAEAKANIRKKVPPRPAATRDAKGNQ